jgi:hypothetical protein
MCEPVSMSVAATAIVASSVAKGVSDKMAADASASAQRRNAIVSEQAASLALQRGEEDAGRIQMKGSSLQGAQRAGYGASGADVNSGSAALTQEDTAQLTEVDKTIARNNAQREAWGLERQADNMRSSADATETAGWLALGGDIIQGASNAVALGSGGAAKAPGKA